MEKVFINGRFHAAPGIMFPALLVRDGKVEAVGENGDITRLSHAAETIDLEGRTVLPGFNDSHMHLLNTGAALRSVDLYGADSIDNVICRGREYLRTHTLGSGDVLLGRGWNDDYFLDQHRFLTRGDLDLISRDVPILFTRVCGHVISANTAALRLAGVTADTPQPEGGAFELGVDGEPNGVFKERATGLIQTIIPKPDVNEFKQSLIAAMNHASEQGITSVQTNDFTPDNWPRLWQAYKELEEEERATVRIYQQTLFHTPEEYSDFLNHGFHTGVGDDMVKTGPLKLLMDGSLGARTALLRRDYADMKGSRGIKSIDESDLESFLRLAWENRCQAAIHAIGDGACELVLDAFEKILPPGRNPLRWGIVHCQITDRPLLERFARGKIHAMVQPIFLHYDTHIVESRVGKDLAATSYAFGSMDSLGVPLSFGTDSPVEDLNPFRNIYCAVTRKDLSGIPNGGYHPEESLSLQKAVTCYTLGGAYNSFEENIKGKLLPGFLADFVALDRDIFSIPADEIKDVRADMTVLGGKVVYRA